MSFLALVPVVAASLSLAQDTGGPVVLSERERELALELSPLPAPPADPTNAYADDDRAAALGRSLFFDERLSAPGTVSCATCHDPRQGWSDGRELPEAVLNGPRHTMSLWNVGYNRWFFWDGRKDSLWSQALAPFEDPREHATSRLAIAHVVANDAAYARAYEELFGALPPLDDAARFPKEGRPVQGNDNHPHAQAWRTMNAEDQLAVDRLYVNLGKSIAAFERRIVSRRAPYDVFVEGLREDDPEKLAALSPSAQRGFALFVGKGNCVVCHDGPNFTDGEFHTNRFPTAEGADLGRPLGIRMLYRDPFNTRSAWADDGGATGETKLNIAPRGAHLPGEFKTPSLRNVARTAPYMHEGQVATLEEVIEFYSTLKGAEAEPLNGERILKVLDLTSAEKADLLAFLEALTDESALDELDLPELAPRSSEGARSNEDARAGSSER